ncbi:MAG: TIGR02594 family protein [Xanthobacteraceae bacterium]|nr:TIGR02594 family protein [Xanthobacteraceae bacterium]
MKRTLQTLLVFTTAAAACSPAFAIGEKKEERFVLSSAASVPTHRSENTTVTASVPSTDKKASIFAIGLEALKWVGASSRQVGVPYPDLWCADFINFILRRTGHPTTNSRAARSFLDYGKRIDSPRVGAIVVLTRGKDGGHVGIVRGTDGAGNIIVISGNHGNKVWESPYPKERVLGYVVPPNSN